MPFVLDPFTGETHEVAPEQLEAAIERGMQVVPGPGTEGLGLGGLVGGVAERAASGLTFGLSDVALDAAGLDTAERAKRLGLFGDVVEGAAGLAALRPTSVLRFTPAGALGRLAASAKTVKGAAGLAALEGAAIGAGDVISEEALAAEFGGYDALAERIFAGAASGAIFGGVAGGAVAGALGGAGRLAKRFAPRPDVIADRADLATFRAVNPNPEAVVRLSPQRAADVGRIIRNYETPNGRIVKPFDASEDAAARLSGELKILEEEGRLLTADRNQIQLNSQRLGAELQQVERELAQKAQTLDLLQGGGATRELRAAGRVAGPLAGSGGPLSGMARGLEGDVRQLMARRDQLRRQLAGLSQARGPLDARWNELTRTVSAFKDALKHRRSSPSIFEGATAYTGATIAGSLVGGSVTGLVAGAGAIAARVARNRMATTWAALLDRIEKGDLPKKAREVFRLAPARTAVVAGALSDDEYWSVRQQVRDVATGHQLSEPAIADDAPRIAQSMMAVQVRAAQYLDATAPTPPKLTDNPNLARIFGQQKPDPISLERWTRRVEAADDPSTVLSNPTREGVETLAAVYPRLFAETKVAVMEELADEMSPLTPGQRARLASLFGMSQAEAHALVLNQQMYAALREKASQRPNLGSAMATSRRIVKAAAEELESGEDPK